MVAGIMVVIVTTAVALVRAYRGAALQVGARRSTSLGPKAIQGTTYLIWLYALVWVGS